MHSADRVPMLEVSLADDLTLALFEIPSVTSQQDFALLSEAERARSARFVFEPDRSRFVTTRAALRRLLASRCDTTPADVVIETDSLGRPHLAGMARTAAPDLDFNVSHSGSLSAVSLSRGRRIGVDLEWHERISGLREIELQVMGVLERQMLERLQSEDYTRAFLGCWTRKEAIIKAIGVGVRYPLATIDIPLVPADGAVEFHATDGQVWSVATVEVNTNYTLSLAIAGQTGRIVTEALSRLASTAA